jgi:hypothetical protein
MRIKLQATLGFMQVGLDQQTSTNCKSKLWFGLDEQFSTLVLKFNFIFSISSGCGRTEYEFPTCIKPWPLGTSCGGKLPLGFLGSSTV